MLYANSVIMKEKAWLVGWHCRHLWDTGWHRRPTKYRQ